MPQLPNDRSNPAQQRHFATTQWSLVLAAGQSRDEVAAAALSELCQTYWHPINAYVRRRGYSVDDALDLTQAFFARLLEKNAVQVADPNRGKFRSFLLASMDHFLANEFNRARTQKRGGGVCAVSLDGMIGESLEPVDEMTPKRLYERQWALTLLETVVQRLSAEYQANGNARMFELLKEVLSGGHDRMPYAGIAEELRMTVDAVRKAAHRLRSRYRILLREEVGRTVAHAEEIDGELASLFEALGK